MKTFVPFAAVLFVLLILNGCSVKKSYMVYSSKTLNKINGNDSIAVIDLTKYDIYRREYYFLHTKDTLIKGYEGKEVNSANIRYEMQFFLVEKTSAATRRVIYVGMYPPYKDNVNWVYNNTIYDRLQVFNVGLINYVMFGTLTNNDQVKFVKDKSVSLWDVSFQAESLAVDHVLFRNGSKMVSEDPSLRLQYKPVYTKLHNCKIFLHYYQKREVSSKNTDYFKKEYELHYNTVKHTLSIEFKEPLDSLDPEKKTWIQYRSNRILAKFQ
jgi:hypothetical protein